MELVYCWIKDFENLKDIELNISGEYDIEYKKEEKKLEIRKNLNYMENFWGNNIKNITAIIGKNGSGKSSILNFIIFLMSKVESYKYYEIIFIVKEQKKLTIVANDNLINNKNMINCDLEILKDVILYNTKKYKNEMEGKTETKINSKEIFNRKSILNKMHCIYFSNIFDVNNSEYYFRTEFYNNLSKNSLFFEARRNYFDEVDINDYGFFRQYMILQQLNFISKNKVELKKINNTKFKIPNEIIITTDYDLERGDEDSIQSYSGSKEKLIRYENKDLISNFEEIIYDKLDYLIDICKNKREYDLNICILYKSFMIRIIDSYWNSICSIVHCSDKFVQERLKQELNLIDSTKFENDCKIVDYLKVIEETLIKLIKTLKRPTSSIGSVKMPDFPIGGEQEIKKIQDESELYFKLIKKLEEFIFGENYGDFGIIISEGIYLERKDNCDSRETELRGTLGIVLTDKSLNFLAEFLDLYKKLSNPNFFVFEWRNMSSGERALLDLYSVLYSIVNEIKNDNILLLIDEGELYLHPEWQRQYIKTLIDYLSVIYKDKNIQIIFASNSPFLISDIPRNNVIVLDKIDDKIVVSNTKIKKQTFGANISTLLNDSFFMESSIGEFAKYKINDVIQKIKNLENHLDDEEYKQYIKKFIDLIDEPIIKRKLSMEYYKRCGNIEEEIRSLEEEIKIKKQRIDELKKGNL